VACVAQHKYSILKENSDLYAVRNPLTWPSVSINQEEFEGKFSAQAVLISLCDQLVVRPSVCPVKRISITNIAIPENSCPINEFTWHGSIFLKFHETKPDNLHFCVHVQDAENLFCQYCSG
jgi:hypothetical protein